KFGGKFIQVVHNSINQGDTINCSFLLKSRFRLAGNDNPLCRVNRPGIAEGFYPVIQMMFKVVRRAEAIYAHGTEEVPDAFTHRVCRRLHESNEWWYPGTVIGTGKHSGEYVYRCTEPESFVAAMVFISAQRQK